MSEEKEHEKRQTTTNIQGQVYGPVHTGSGDIHIGQLSYGTGENVLSALRSEIVARIDAASYDTIRTIIEQLSEERIQELDKVLEALKLQHLSDREIMEFLIQVQPAILEAQDHELLPRSTRDTVQFAQVIDAPDLDVAHKLKLSIPIIPFLLDYEAEVDLNSKMNLEKAWDWLRSRLHLSPPSTRGMPKQ